jgi:hypothetical protein
MGKKHNLSFLKKGKLAERGEKETEDSALYFNVHYAGQ